MTREDVRDYASRVALAKQGDRRADARRADLVLLIAAVTLTWMVSVSLLIGLGIANGARLGQYDPAFVLAAAVAVLLPFVAAVLATRNGQVWIGGAYVVLTLAMVLPALGILGLG